MARMPIDPILWQRINELAAKYVVQDLHHVLSAKTEKQAPMKLSASDSLRL